MEYDVSKTIVPFTLEHMYRLTSRYHDIGDIRAHDPRGPLPFGEPTPIPYPTNLSLLQSYHLLFVNYKARPIRLFWVNSDIRYLVTCTTVGPNTNSDMLRYLVWPSQSRADQSYFYFCIIYMLLCTILPVPVL